MSIAEPVQGSTLGTVQQSIAKAEASCRSEAKDHARAALDHYVLCCCLTHKCSPQVFAVFYTKIVVNINYCSYWFLLVWC
jgi:hypothetical protein